MSNQGFTINLNIDKIGPHYGNNKIAFSDIVDSNKAVFYATNGIGKSFISRSFRLLSSEKREELADDLLTLDTNSGSFSFQISSAHLNKELSIAIDRGNIPSIKNNTDLLFHVFNSDYVEDNIKQKNYTPDGNIEGYILGKMQIDLSKERKHEDKTLKDLKSLEEEIDTIILTAKKELNEEGVKSTTTEFRLIEKESLRNQNNISSISSFDNIVAQLDILSNVPENLEDVSIPTLNVNQSLFNELKDILITQYPKTDWDEIFVSVIRERRDFIEKGLSLSGEGNRCPFCKQLYDENALELIRDYRAYLADKEAEVLRAIENAEKGIDKIVNSLHKSILSTKTAVADVTNIKKFFPSVTSFDLVIPQLSEEAIQDFGVISKMLKDKASDLTILFPVVEELVKKCLKVINAIEDDIKQNKDTILNINKAKQDSSRERLFLRRELCKAQFLKYKEKLQPYYKEYDYKSGILKELQSSILEKEQKARISKREKVYDTLTFFLNRFFADKYSIDKDTFQIRFMGNNIGDKASSILSDGEKSIVAFCFYLASTHLIVEREGDYNKLFFIIDDPVSSMDFHYVYSIAQSLRDIKDFFGISTHERIWVLTHNIEFLSIVARNYILSKIYIMKPGNISPLRHQLLMPYENHLRDIIEISKGNLQPSHTTANSIRHVLETVSRFEYPEKNIEKYIAGNKTLAEDSCIYTLCQDLSHGGIRKQPPFSTEVLIEACKVVVAFMKTKYEGQINAVSNQNCN